MATWKKEDPSCVITWVTSLLLAQTRTPFPKAGAVAMRKLQYWSGDGDVREAQARAFAVQSIHTFRDMFGAEYESGKSFTSALLSMLTVLRDGDKTMADLAKANNIEFKFLEEQ